MQKEKPSKTTDKCEAILRKIVEVCNKDNKIAFERDLGDLTLTIFLNGSHTHVGIPDGSTDENAWNILVDHLYNCLHGGPGLSWHCPEEEE